MLGALLLLNLLVGVLVSTFSSIQKRKGMSAVGAMGGEGRVEAGSEAIISDKQKEWLDLMAQLVSTKPREP